jgi:hypothetical protein
MPARSTGAWHNIIKLHLKNKVRMYGLDKPASEQEPVAGSFEHGNKTAGSI